MTEPPSGSYVRGAAGLTVDSRRVLRLVLGACLLVLAVLTGFLTVQAIHQNTRNHRLQHVGVVVDVTVTKCVGNASGTGVTEVGFTCTGSFALAGDRYTDVIGGASRLRQPGDTLQAVADPERPSVLATTASVANTPASWKPFISAAITLAVFLLIGAVAMLHARRSSRVLG